MVTTSIRWLLSFALPVLWSIIAIQEAERVRRCWLQQSATINDRPLERSVLLHEDVPVDYS